MNVDSLDWGINKLRAEGFEVCGSRTLHDGSVMLRAKKAGKTHRFHVYSTSMVEITTSMRKRLGHRRRPRNRDKVKAE